MELMLDDDGSIIYNKISASCITRLKVGRLHSNYGKNLLAFGHQQGRPVLLHPVEYICKSYVYEHSNSSAFTELSC